MLVDSGTGRFLKKDGGWTADQSRAASFDDYEALIERCRSTAVKQPEIVLRFNNDPQLDVRVPLRC